MLGKSNGELVIDILNELSKVSYSPCEPCTCVGYAWGLKIIYLETCWFSWKFPNRGPGASPSGDISLDSAKVVGSMLSCNDLRQKYGMC